MKIKLTIGASVTSSNGETIATGVCARIDNIIFYPERNEMRCDILCHRNVTACDNGSAEITVPLIQSIKLFTVSDADFTNVKALKNTIADNVKSYLEGVYGVNTVTIV